MWNVALKQQHDKMTQQQAIMQQAIAQQSIRTAPWQQSANLLKEQLEQQRAVAVEQIQQSETNLAAQYQSIMQQQQVHSLFSLTLHSKLAPDFFSWPKLCIFGKFLQ